MENKDKHTPGPWTLRPDCWVSANGDDIITFATAGNKTRHYYHGSGETLANARLCSAAPELLQAVRRAIPIIAENCPDNNHEPTYSPEAEVLTLLHKALDKAEGK